MAKVSLRIQGATAAVEAVKDLATLSAVAAAASATASSEASRHAGLRAAAASEAAANATRVSEAAAVAAAMAVAAAKAAAAEVATAYERLHWKFNMSLRLADGAIEEVAAAHADKLPRERPPAVLNGHPTAIFAASPDLWDKLGVPVEFRPLTSTRLEGVFWHVGSTFPGSVWVSKRHFSRLRGSGGTKHRWFAIQLGEPLVLLKQAILEGEAKQSAWQTAASAAQIDKEKLRVASEAGLNCEVCTMSVLRPDDPQFAEKANDIAQLCHGGVRIPCGCPHTSSAVPGLD